MTEGSATFQSHADTADVFISYSKARPKVTKELASYLETEGFSVWWDTELKPYQVFRREIDARLNAAKAVIIIWTSQSVESDWVIAEADHGYRQRKLINTRTSDINANRIPKPFNQIHTVEVTERAAIVSALEGLGVLRNKEIQTPKQSMLDRLLRRPIVLASFVLLLVFVVMSYYAIPFIHNFISVKVIEAIKEDDGAWSETQKIKTTQVYQAYLKDYPRGRHADEARAAIEAINKDDNSWSEAQKVKTGQVYQAYLKDYPHGQHAIEARAAIEAWCRAEARARLRGERCREAGRYCTFSDVQLPAYYAEIEKCLRGQ